MDMPEIDPNFEPQLRARSNTWPVRPKDLTEDESARISSSVTTSADGDRDVEVQEKHSEQGLIHNKKAGGSRRNAWGNLSYADLITKAIQSSPEQRLTLSQIYDWMVQNVPYFSDKGDSNSSAGWKNSIRHNLSLHSRFMRVQNEGTGKSSWWVLNPDAKPGKTPRRRATSMDTKAYEKKRGRVKKKVEALRAAMAGDNLSETGSCYGGSAQDLNIPDNFNLSPQDFRQRTSSNASSMGRLSPIQSILEPDLHDNQVPPMSPIPWGQNLNTSPYNTGQEAFADQSLSESLAEMFVGESGIDVTESLVARSNLSPSVQPQQQISHSPTFQNNSQSGFIGHSYIEQLQSSPQPSQMLSVNHMSPARGAMAQISPSGINTMSQPSSEVGSVVQVCTTNELNNQYVPQSLTELLDSDTNSLQQSFLSQVDQVMASPPQGSTLGQYGAYGISNDSQARHSSSIVSQNTASIQGGPLSINNSLLRQALTTNSPINIKHANKSLQDQLALIQHQSHGQNLNSGGVCTKQPELHNSSMSGPTTIQPQLMAGGTMHTNPHQCPPSLPTDIDMNLTADFTGCDVDQILKHELAFDDNLDFNFDSEQPSDGGVHIPNTQGKDSIYGVLKT